jgi:hypothetical protein
LKERATSRRHSGRRTFTALTVFPQPPNKWLKGAPRNRVGARAAPTAALVRGLLGTARGAGDHIGVPGLFAASSMPCGAFALAALASKLSRFGFQLRNAITKRGHFYCAGSVQ